ncbi:putative isomerase YraM [Mycolicibacterium madagascariense]|uniref:Putative isomerase YraM n=1 Tax=Mycolicibacterium madagascariense TaxID=212765 RepID=A0A7I7XD36_9MYCO|nr:PrpF domain-containing protein [Mycolicibacterium madagascariense]MCV7015231.1 PrpF protein [Mycolicibacterium madagascariense]BBZ27524.1 putative isomerase YraM [Mycolicibacterium madagascariense]
MLIPTDQETLRLVLARGGTSKGLYFHEQDIPPAGPERDAVLCRLMGSPDLNQIDGLGGAKPVTSKLAIVAPSTRDDADVEYTFGQVQLDQASVDYTGNCGNISAGVGPFAIDEGLITPTVPVTTVRIHNTNTDKILVAEVPVVGGRAAVLGDAAIAGVPGTGAPITMDWKGTVGSATGSLLPTGNVTDDITLESGDTVSVSIVDAGNITCWITAADVGLTGSEQAAEIEKDTAAMKTLFEIRAKAAAAAGLVDEWTEANSPNRGLPLTGVVAGPGDYTAANGDEIPSTAMDVRVRLIFLDRLHPTIAGTGSIALTAASRVPGSVVARASAASADSGELRIGHPGGVMTNQVQTAAEEGDEVPTFTKLAMIRTARRLMSGAAYIPREDHPIPTAAPTGTGAVHEGD